MCREEKTSAAQEGEDEYLEDLSFVKAALSDKYFFLFTKTSVKYLRVPAVIKCYRVLGQ